MKIDLNIVNEGGNPHQIFLDSIRDSETKRKYRSYLRQFLAEVPDNVYEISSEKMTDSEEGRARQFVLVARQKPEIAYAVISQYIKIQKKRVEKGEYAVEKGELNANTLPNLIKPIHALLDSNGIAIHWKSLYKMYPRPTRTEGRGYTKDELQSMMKISHDITDKVILTVFSSAGFRLEAWDYLCWKDVTFFKNDDGTFRGAALLIYRGDPKIYYTFITPEACNYLDMYKEKWNKDIGKYPTSEDPLLRITTQITIKRLYAKGVKSRVTNLTRETELRPKLPPGSKRHAVPIDHGFRKYFNTMMRRAKVNYLYKEDTIVHSTGLEKHYEQYCEEDFERFPEYQKAIPFLTIDDSQIKLDKMKQEKSKLEKDYIPREEMQKMIKNEIKEQIRNSLFKSY